MVIERGKDVRARRRDLAKLNREHVVNPESNYCFGEGGAGTTATANFYTRSKKRGDIREALEGLSCTGRIRAFWSRRILTLAQTVCLQW